MIAHVEHARGAVQMERFWAKVAAGDPRECWLWLGARKKGDYGHLHIGPRQGGRWIGAHRRAYELFYGAIPGDLPLDHLCRNRLCVNPLHLEPVTNVENIRRGIKGVLTTHCPAGHEYTTENTYSQSGRRKCRVCQRIRAMEKRKDRPKKERLRMSHCKRGHELTHENTYIAPSGHRTCRICRRASWRRTDARRRQKV